VVSAGMKLNIVDLNKDGRNDIVIAGKGGLYVFYNQGNPPTPPLLHKLAPEDAYPTWRNWPEYEVLFDSKDLTGWKVPAGDESHVRVVDGVINYDGKSETKDDTVIWTAQSFEDFCLHVEWRFDPDRNASDPGHATLNAPGSSAREGVGRLVGGYSGVIVRGTPRGQLGERRVLEGGVEKLEKAAILYDLETTRPAGQWNSYDFTIVGNRAAMMVNGKTIEASTHPRLTESGPIGLQYDLPSRRPLPHSVVQFRNILVRKLPRNTEQVRSVPARASEETPRGVTTNGFATLFNGKDLAGWITGPDNFWVVQDGVLTVTRPSDGKEHNFDYLWTKDTYGDFVLDLEFKVTQGTNSGIFFHTADLKDPVYTGIEVQIVDSAGRPGLSRTATTGAIYDCLAPTKNAIKPAGEWNHCILTCQGSRVEVVLNGDKIIDMDVDQWSKAGANPDGTPNKFKQAIKDFARVGYVGFQDHGRPVWYRNIKIKRL
jgi:hypothetical protein